MRRDRDRSLRGFAAPQALAVLSCALALLLAQPPAAHGHAMVATPVIESASLDGVPGSRSETGTCESGSHGSAVSSSRLFFTSARRLHVLATMDILHRMLVGELRAAPRVTLDGISYSFGLLCFVQPTPPALPAFQKIEQLAALSAERACIRLRSQLAPPSV